MSTDMAGCHVDVVWAPVRHEAGWRAECDCGWRSPVYAVDEHAIDAALAHRHRTPDHAFGGRPGGAR